MIHFTEETIRQSENGVEKIWHLSELLEHPDPLAGEPLAGRNAAMRKVVEMAASSYADLSEVARLRYDFWYQLLPHRIPEQHFAYTTKVTNTYQWELTINSNGLFYKDVSGEYTPQPGTVTEQLLSNFWFYGPLLPIPDLQVRKQLAAAIRNAFLQGGSPASYKHFSLFDYPVQPVSPLHWTFGDYRASDFINVRDYGIETGAANWHDGLVWLHYTSFEHFLTLPTPVGSLFTPEIRACIEELLAPKISVEKEFDRAEPDGNTESKRLFMSSAGQTGADKNID
jgi:hypothetical protein